jgi:hypothetical protein
MQCPKCLTINNDILKFCMECGTDGWVEKYQKELKLL